MHHEKSRASPPPPQPGVASEVRVASLRLWGWVWMREQKGERRLFQHTQGA